MAILLWILKNWKAFLFGLMILSIILLSWWVSALKNDVKDLDGQISELQKTIEIVYQETEQSREDLETCKEENEQLNIYYCEQMEINSKKDKQLRDIQKTMDKLKAQECKCEKELTPEINEELLNIYDDAIKEI